MTHSLTTERLAFKPFGYPWAYDFWKKQQQVHWMPEEVPMADDIKDWIGLEEGERELLTQIFRFFTQGDVEVNNCFVAGTEVLTQRGFIDFSELQPNDLVAQVSKDGLTTTFVKPQRLVRQHHKGEVVRFWNKAGTVDATVTPDHQMLFERVGTKDQGSRYKEAASSLEMTQYKAFHTAAPSVGGTSELSPKEKLLIAYQADGSKKEKCGGTRKPTYSMYFAFLKDRKIERMRLLLTETGYEFVEGKQESQWGTYTTFVVKYPHGQPAFDLSWVDLSDKSSEWCQAFLEEASYWDAWRSDGYVQYRSTNKASSDMMTAIRTLAGYSGKTTHCNYECNSEHWLVAWSENYRPVRGSLIHKEVLQYDGEVFCVTVPDGNIIVRNNGAVLVCGNCYHRIYLSIFKPTEVVMMLTSFANMETIHIAAYSLLMETIGMPEGEYTRFMEYKAMRDKFEFGRSFEVTDPRSVALAMAVFGAFTEGLQLFASFAMLMNFPRFNKMKGMGQIVTWSIRDESLHCEGILRLYHAYCQENGLVGDLELGRQITEALHVIVSHEDAFIDQAFAGGPVKGMNPEDLKAYIRWIANMRMRQLHMPEAFVVKKNPLPWLEAQLNGVEHANFFEARSTEYSKAAIKGSFDDASFDDAFA